jgi:HEAT repeat protein
MAFIKKQTSQIVNEDERKIPRDFDGLCVELNHEDSKVRRWAVRDLAQLPNASSVLVTRLEHEDNASVRTAILNALAKLGDTIAMNGLVECLRSEEAALRNEAIEILKELPHEVEPIIDELLTDADSDVRIFAVNILESLRHQHVEQWLIGVIEKDSHVNVCSTALDLLSEIGTELAVPAIKQLKARFPDEPYVCFSADLALKRIEDEER